MRSITAVDLATELATPSKQAKLQLLDVREPWEFELCQIGGSTNIPMNQIASRIAEVDFTITTVVICHHGVRSARVILFLQQRGIETLINLTGGVDAWARGVEPEMTLY